MVRLQCCSSLIGWFEFERVVLEKQRLLNLAVLNLNRSWMAPALLLKIMMAIL